MSRRLEHAIRSVFGDEGLYSNDPNDPGGETVLGIARRMHPTWYGWRLVDERRLLLGFPRSLAGDLELQRLVAEFYDVAFWRPLRCDELPDPIGEKVFEAAVNIGHEPAIKILQLALCAEDRPVKVDGRIGPTTLATVRAIDAQDLYDTLQCGQAGYYLGKVSETRRKRLYLTGWLNRALAENDGAASAAPR